ncbi:hypothetical protein KO116_P200209 (plasmid) [Halomonas sp. KO116]|nr:hypothetical protein KO116_P200209 [Halomonas sp. KO116]
MQPTNVFIILFVISLVISAIGLVFAFWKDRQKKD